MAQAIQKISSLPKVRGRITENAPLGAVGWFKAGGTADILFKPADRDDLTQFLTALPADIPVQVFGVMSNTIIRDGGVRGVTVRLGKEFSGAEARDGHRVAAYAMTLDSHVATTAAQAGIAGLEFYSGIPGTIGGALRMNAGCYGTESRDVLIVAEAVGRDGRTHELTPAQMGMAYRHTSTPEDYIFLGAVFQGVPGDPEKIAAHMAEIKAKREKTQPIREATGGSTFANPTQEEVAGAGLPEGTKVWQLIDRAKCRGLRLGGAQMSELHCNFMINTGGATAADLENLGEEVRRRVYEDCGITLRWEIKRIGERVNG